MPALADPSLISKAAGESFVSNDHQTKAAFEKNGCDITVTRRGRKLYSIHTSHPFSNPPGHVAWPAVKSARDLGFLSGEVYVSNDGRTLVWLLLPTFFGHLLQIDVIGDGVKHASAPGPTVDRTLSSMPALAVFRDGRLLRAYSLSELLVRPELVHQTASHTTWLASGHNTFSKGYEPELSADEQRFVFETTSFRKYVLHTQNGRMEVASDVDPWSAADLVVWGKLVQDGAQNIHVKIEYIKVLKGVFPDTQLTFVDTTRTYSAAARQGLWSGVALQKRKSGYRNIAPISVFPMY